VFYLFAKISLYRRIFLAGVNVLASAGETIPVTLPTHNDRLRDVFGMHATTLHFRSVATFALVALVY